MIILKCNFSDADTAIPGFNNICSPEAALDEIIHADLLNTDDVLSGVQLKSLIAWTNSGASGAIADGDYHTWEQEAWIRYWIAASALNGDTLELSNLPVGATYTLKIAGTNTSLRDTAFDSSGSTNGPLVYVAASTSPPNIWVELVGVVPGNGIINIYMEGALFSYLTAFELEYTGGGGPTRVTHTLEIDNLAESSSLTFTSLSGLSFVNNTTGESTADISTPTISPSKLLDCQTAWSINPVDGDAIDAVYDSVAGDWIDTLTGLPIASQTFGMMNCADTPPPVDIELITGVLATGQSMTVNTSTLSFGTNAQPAPALLIRGSRVEENGVTNVLCPESEAIQDAPVLGVAQGDTDSLWTSTTEGSETVRIDKVDLPHSDLDSVYRGEYKGVLLLPNVLNSPTFFHEKLFVKYKTKSFVDLKRLKQIGYTGAITGGPFNVGADEFTYGETLTINFSAGGSGVGTLVNVDTVNQLLLLVTAVASADFLNATVVGDTSGASVITSASLVGQSTKSMRGNEKGAGNNELITSIPLALGQITFYSRDTTGAIRPGTTVIRYYASDSYNAWSGGNVGSWHSVEHYADYSAAGERVMYTMDSNKHAYIEGVITTDKTVDSGPNLSSFGMENNVADTIPVAALWGDLYCHTTPQRVVIGNASTWPACTIDEVCVASAWADQSVTCELYRGMLPALDGGAVWVYVFNADSSNLPINTDGVLLT